MLRKEEIVDTIEHIDGEKFDDIDDLIENIMILEKIQIGLEQARNGQLTSMEDFLKEMKEW